MPHFECQKAGNSYIIKGDTFPFLNTLRSLGGILDKEKKIWTFTNKSYVQIMDIIDILNMMQAKRVQGKLNTGDLRVMKSKLLRKRKAEDLVHFSERLCKEWKDFVEPGSDNNLLKIQAVNQSNKNICL
jgi:hypothetical protein